MKISILNVMIIAGLLLYSSCRSKVDQHIKDDTTIALKVLLDTAFYKPRLVPTKPFRDTVIFEYDEVLLHHLPADLPHILLKESEMCEFMSLHKLSSFQFFSLDFRKTKQGYQTSLGTHCMARGVETKYSSETKSIFCERQSYCNAVLTMDIIKKGNKFMGSKFNIMTY